MITLEELLGEFKLFDEVFEDLGDVSGLVTLDIGSGGGSMVSYLVRKNGPERVFAIDLFTGTLGLLKKKLSSEEMLKVIFIKADLRRLDFLKDCFFDIVIAYDTLSVVEKFTPSGTEYVLNEVYRILKPKGYFVVIEHSPIDLIRPMDEAHKVEIGFWSMHIKIDKALDEPAGVEYTPQSLVKTIKNFSFEVSHWKELRTTYLEQYPGFGSVTIQRVKKVSDEDLREELLQEIEQIDRDGKKHGMRSIPHYVVYAAKPSPAERRKTELPTLKELYDTTHHRDLLGC